MRKHLELLHGQRLTFRGVFVRQGKKRAYRGYGNLGDGHDRTVLLRDITDESKRLVADHLWFNMTETFVAASPVEGDVIQFDARVDDYTKGYERDHYDYKLSRPTKVVNLGRISHEPTVHPGPIRDPFFTDLEWIQYGDSAPAEITARVTSEMQLIEASLAATTEGSNKYRRRCKQIDRKRKILSHISTGAHDG
jgi:phenylpropionate dioxygenase-like ring-hydroxylating dioxygenase large terminal subunit